MNDVLKGNTGKGQEALKMKTFLDINKAMNSSLELTKALNDVMRIEREKEALIQENNRLRIDLERERELNNQERQQIKTKPKNQLSIEKVLEIKLNELMTVMDTKTLEKRRLYADIISKVEKAMIKLALLRTKNIKSEAARFLGINRNTLHKKINDLKISA